MRDGDPYRSAPAARFYTGKKTFVDLAAIVEMWFIPGNSFADDQWVVRYSGAAGTSNFSKGAGEPVFAALLAYRREAYA